jgi:hypothetical protein
MYLIDELVLNFHFFAKLAPDFSQGQLVISMNEPVQPHNMKLILVTPGHFGDDGFYKLQS